MSEPVAAIDGAIEQLNQFRDSPAGHIRLNVAVEAATLLLAPSCLFLLNVTPILSWISWPATALLM